MHFPFRFALLLATIFVAAVLSPQAADAHRSNESYIYFNVSDSELSGRFEANLADLDTALGIGGDDGEVTIEEFQARSAEIFDFFADRLIISHEGQQLRIAPGPVTWLDAEGRIFGQIGFTVPDLEDIPDSIMVEYRPLDDVVRANHLGFALVESNTRTGLTDNESYISLSFEPGAGPQRLSLTGEPWGKIFRDFIVHGVWHIWLGFDHVVFLITLLLPAVLRPAGRSWIPEEEFRQSFFNVVKLATVFTVSHSITLGLSALGIFRLNITLVEAIIAFSIIAVALMNFFPSAHSRVLLIVFAFGLFHGFGFANVLAPLGVDPGQKLLGLAAFNVGVEIGQIAIVVVAFPILWGLKRFWLYKPVILYLGSAVMILLGATWLVGRTTDVDVRGSFNEVTGLDL